MATSKLFVPEMVDDKDIIFTKDSNYQKQKEKEKKNPIFKRNKYKKQGSKNKMANLKYRAWNKELQTMLDVSLIDFKKRVLVGEHWRFGETNFMSFDEIELMQSTGRKDTSENEIFAGDILKVIDKNEGKDSWFEVVSYSEEKAMFVTDEINKNFKVPAAPLYSLFDTDLFIVEIVGNIYENSELVGDKQ